MTTCQWKCILPLLILAVPAAVYAQSGAQGGAKGPRGGFFPWWDSPLVNGLDLSDAQRGQIASVIREYRGRMLEVRRSVQKAETDLEDVFNQDTMDQRRGAEAIDHLTKARADMTKSVSEMSLRMRAVLTSQQWQQLQRRQREQGSRLENVGRGSGSPRGGGRGRRLSKGDPKGPAPAENQVPPPALSQQ